MSTASTPGQHRSKSAGNSGITENLFISDYLLESLPVVDVEFDLVYAFSVFTHLSLRATSAALNTLAAYMKPEGLLIITIRPGEYWQGDGHTSEEERRRLIDLHRTTGFAFNPHIRAPVNGDVTYGDTSMTLEWLKREMPQWTIVGSDYLDVDPYQRLICLQPTRA